MGVILQFRQTTEPVPRATEPADGVLCQVVIFPGVRIERRVDAPSGRAAPVRKRAQRARKKQR
jgi:hypothetical protein